VKCFHCGAPCRHGAFAHDGRSFCCHGCLTVFELLSENGLSNFYELADTAGVRVKPTRADQFKYLDEALVRERLVDFQDERMTRVTFHIPAIHCIACVWLLENLFRLKAGVGESQVNFPRKEVAITFENERVKLSEVVTLLASLGYEPELKLSDLSTPRRHPVARRLWIQLALAGFAFGNLMLLAIGNYFGVDAFTGPLFRKLAGYIGLLLAIPVVAYSALDYWRTAWASLKQRRLAIEVPIAAGIVAIFAQSAYEVLSGVGEGYFDSLSGLIFFLLCGRLFQQKTFDRLSFERDYQSFFPLSVTRKGRAGSPLPAANGALRTSRPTHHAEEHVSLAQLGVGDVLIIRNGELIPADSRVLSGEACIDYSFVTGESEPVARHAGEYLYAGGRQIGSAIEIEMVKAVSQSYLTSLWNQEAFRKDKSASFETLINAYSYRFTLIVIAIAIGAAAFWAFRDPGKALKAFTSVLIVACPCALALAAPFTLGTAIRALGRRDVFVKSTEVVEGLAKVDTVVFDKTGTLTAAGAQSIQFEGASLNPDEHRCLYSLVRYSTHPLSVRVAESLRADFSEPVRSFAETVGCGIEGVVAGHEITLGSTAWLNSRGVQTNVPRAASGFPLHEPDGRATHRKSTTVVGQHRRRAEDSAALPSLASSGVPGAKLVSGNSLPVEGRGSSEHAFEIARRSGSVVHVAINGTYRGCFVLESALRRDVDALVGNLSPHYGLALLSGDNEKQRDTFAPLFGDRTQFNQSPLSKLEFIHTLQRSGKTVMMVGDGLNDAGALKQSDVGVAVVETISAFSPASDVIMSAGMLSQLDAVLRFSKRAVRIVRLSFLLSSLYNVIGISIAANGLLAPIVCAILMPISSISVVAFACGATTWVAQRSFRGRANLDASAAIEGEPVAFK
jgi:Cu+-exporting ATPase